MDGVDPMGRHTKYAPEEIVAKLRQLEIMPAQGQAMADAIRTIGGYRAARERPDHPDADLARRVDAASG